MIHSLDVVVHMRVGLHYNESSIHSSTYGVSGIIEICRSIPRRAGQVVSWTLKLVHFNEYSQSHMVFYIKTHNITAVSCIARR